jgi:hypothetical protein
MYVDVFVCVNARPSTSHAHADVHVNGFTWTWTCVFSSPSGRSAGLASPRPPSPSKDGPAQPEAHAMRQPLLCDGACGGNSFCYSTGICIPSVLSNSCQCGGAASESQCATGHPACSAAGGACNDGVHACCVGETCIGCDTGCGTCVAGCGQCAGVGCSP